MITAWSSNGFKKSLFFHFTFLKIMLPSRLCGPGFSLAYFKVFCQSKMYIINAWSVRPFPGRLVLTATWYFAPIWQFLLIVLPLQPGDLTQGTLKWDLLLMCSQKTWLINLGLFSGLKGWKLVTLYMSLFFFQPEVRLQNGEARRTQKRVKKQKTISAFYSSLLTLISVCGVNYRMQRCNRSSW